MGTSRSAAAAMMLGGLLTAALFVPFTLAHGPTSVDLEREVAGWDMHAWGFLLGTVPPLLVGGGLWLLRERIAGGRRTSYGAVTVMCVAMFIFAAMNLTFRAIGPPIDLFLLAPASVVAALTTGPTGTVKMALRLIALAYVVAMALALVPREVYDDYDGYRVFGVVAYATTGLLWAVLGSILLRESRTEATVSPA